MDDATAVLAGHTKKYNIPLSHFEYKYIQNCTDGKELERIYKELTGGEVGAFPDLEKLTLDRIRDVKPNSQILRKDKAPLDNSSLPEDERRQFDDFLSQMKETNNTSSNITTDHRNNGIDSVPIRSKSTITKSIPSTSTAAVITNNGKPKRIVPRSYDEWGKLDQKLSRDVNSEDDENDDNEEEENNKKTTIKPRPSEPIHEKSQRLQIAEQHRLNGNAAFKVNNYQQAIDLYTKSIMLDNTNSTAYMNRAIAYYRLNNYDDSITDCSQVLTKDPHHIKALFRRASCQLAKQQYDEAKCDLDLLLTIDEENNEAKTLLKSIPTVPKTKGVRIPITEDDDDEDEQVPTQSTPSAPVKIPIVEVEEEEEEEDTVEQVNIEPVQSMSIDIPQKLNHHARPCIDSQDASPAMFDHHFHHRDDIHHFQQNVHSQLSSLHSQVHADDDDDNDDGMELGDEANADLLGNMSDEDGNISRSLNVSPTMCDEEEEVPELVDQKSLQTTPLISSTRQTTNNNNNKINHSIAFATNDTYNTKDFSAAPDDDLYDTHRISTITNNYSTNKSNSISTNPFETSDTSSQPRPSVTTSYNDQISNSNFSPIIQSWLRDLVASQSSRSSSSIHEKPWSRSSRPWALDKLQRDIDRFNRSNDCRNTIDASKKMLKNGVLDYHSHADHIVNTLIICAQCYSKTSEYVKTVQYATEALQYNKIDGHALLCRARAFENEKFLLFSYADYARIPSNDYSYALAQRAYERLAVELQTAEGDAWRNKLPQDQHDDERFLTYIKNKNSYTDNNQYEWYRERGNQFYLDACFILAIQCYTHCIELKSNIPTLYSNRAACYLKVFEPQKAIDDCNKALEIDPKNVRAVYRKACGYKMLHNDELYELALTDLIRLQPNNQAVLSEYYASRHEQIPREMRRLRTDLINNNNTIPTSTSSSSNVNNSKPSIVISELSYEELEDIRAKKTLPLSANTPYQFTQQLDQLKSNDIKSQCSLILRLPTKGLFKITSTATPKLVETIVTACRTMVTAEKRYQQEHKSSIVSFSYISFCFTILGELTTLPRIESALLMINETCRASLDDLLAYYSSIPSILHDVHKLDRLRK